MVLSSCNMQHHLSGHSFSCSDAMSRTPVKSFSLNKWHRPIIPDILVTETDGLQVQGQPGQLIETLSSNLKTYKS